jgi:hypothetical protein
MDNESQECVRGGSLPRENGGGGAPTPPPEAQTAAACSPTHAATADATHVA